MKQISYNFEDIKSLEKFIENDIQINNENILVQLFCGTTEIKVIKPIVQSIKGLLPKANIIGASSAGEINNGMIQDGSIVISFSMFEQTKIDSYYFSEVDFQTGYEIAKQIIKDDTKVCIVFCEALSSDSESFLQGFTKQNPSVIVAGGNAGDNYKFEQTLIIYDDLCYTKGVVIATLSSSKLIASSNYSLEWTPIGKEMSVTKCDKNIVYEIDGIGVKELYKHYLGQEVMEHIPASIISFPLVKIDDEVMVARSTIAETEDGLVYAGHFKVGEKVRFAIGNVDEIISNADKLQKNIQKTQVEAIYVYSCSVRNLFLKQMLSHEISLINSIAPSVGFFTYGEFYHSNSKNQLLNITTTTLSLSEDSDKFATIKENSHYSHEDLVLKPLTNLVNATQNELDESVRLLRQYKNALDASSIVSKTTSNGIITYVNQEFCNISGYTKEELIGRNHNIVRHPENPKSLFEQMWQTIQSGQIWRGNFKNRAKDGSSYYVKSVVAPILDEFGRVVEYIAIRTDITELIKKDEIIQKQYTDELTGLKNKEAMFEVLKSKTEDIALFLINIDRFSLVNDYFGYDAGDEILKQLANVLKKEIQHKEVYRISGDEFGVVCIENRNIEKIKEHIFAHIYNIIEKRFRVGDVEIKLDYSCGVALASSDDVYKFAHMALKEATLKKERVVFYNENKKLASNAKNNIDIVNQIRIAIEEDRVVPFYQGIVDNRSKKITKYEVLMRIQQKDGTYLAPFFFLEHAKGAKLYDQLTQIMIEKSFKEFEHRDCEFSLNLTIKDVTSAATTALLFECISRYRCQGRVILELVESEGIENFEDVVNFISDAKQKGFRIAVDDFGSGYSNFSYLVQFQVDFIKIDGSIIKNIVHDKNSQIILQSILFFSKAMGLKTIAEFVEDEQMYQVLDAWGVDFSQGYYFSKPSACVELECKN